MSRAPLSAEDARILALESGTVRGHTCKVIVIAGERSAEQVRAHLEERLGAVPQLTRRLDPAAGPPAWNDDPDFSLERHVIDRGALDDAGLRRLVAMAMETPLDRGHPLWAMDVVSPLAGGRTALVWRIHHALADGMTAMRMARELLLDDRGGAACPAARPTAARPAGHRAGVRGERGLCHRRCARSLGGGPALPARPPCRPTPRGRLRRRAARRAAAHRPRRPGAGDRERRGAQRGERRLRAWLDELGARGGAACEGPGEPASAGRADTANRDSFMFVDLPLEQDDPLARLVAVTRETRECKQRHDAETLHALFRDLRTCPARSSATPSTGR